MIQNTMYVVQGLYVLSEYLFVPTFSDSVPVLIFPTLYSIAKSCRGWDWMGWPPLKGQG